MDLSRFKIDKSPSGISNKNNESSFNPNSSCNNNNLCNLNLDSDKHKKMKGDNCFEEMPKDNLLESNYKKPSPGFQINKPGKVNYNPNIFEVNNFLGIKEKNFSSEKINEIETNESINNISIVESNIIFLDFQKKKNLEMQKRNCSDKMNFGNLGKYKNIKEGKRMTVELIKVLYNIENNNSSGRTSMEEIIVDNNLPVEVLKNYSNKGNDKNLNSSKYSPMKSSNYSRFNKGFSDSANKDNFSSNREYKEESATQNSLNLINKFSTNINDLNDQNEERIKMIAFLVIPRRLNMILQQEPNDKIIPFIFMLSPSENSYISGVENYLFLWKHHESLGLVGYIDVINIDGCSISNKYEHSFQINVNMQNSNSKQIYIIQAPSDAICNKYAKYLQYVSQIIRCRTFKKNKK